MAKAGAVKEGAADGCGRTEYQALVTKDFHQLG
jgi:hypothetical protein